ncbi:MAG: flavodoxin family protein [Longicatena sp.]
MSKRVLVLSGSPRALGNTDLLCASFIDGAMMNDNIVEQVFVRDKHIAYCIGCDVCKEHEGECVHHDDMEEILKQMIEADVIVMASPVYFYTIDAQMKTLIDRSVARYLEIRNKEFYFIMSAADESREALERTVECFRGFTDCLPGALEKGVVYGVGAWKRGSIKGIKAMEEAYELGYGV